MSTTFEAAQAVADAVLYEGYVLYPYRADAVKNRSRWQFGVLMPKDWAAIGGEPWSSTTSVLLEPGPQCTVDLRVRFLHSQQRSVEEYVGGEFRAVETLLVDGVPIASWDEAVDCTVDAQVVLSEIMTGVAGEGGAVEMVSVDQPQMRTEQVLGSPGALGGRIIRERLSLEGVVEVRADAVPGPYGAVCMQVMLGNLTPWPEADQGGRGEATRRALLGAHVVLSVTDGAFVSLLEPPEWAKPAVERCVNDRTFPVLVGDEGDRTTMLSSPIILYDYPQIAAESQADFYDATEMDEMLVLRTMTLTEEEKLLAIGTDPRAAALVERVDTMDASALSQLHGVVREMRLPGQADAEVPWWDPGSDASVSPETDSVVIGGTAIARGSRVRLHPMHGADAQDLFLEGRTATVQAIFRDVDDATHVAVTLDDDPMAELLGGTGRYYYFSPDEVVPVSGPS